MADVLRDEASLVAGFVSALRRPGGIVVDAIEDVRPDADARLRELSEAIDEFAGKAVGGVVAMPGPLARCADQRREAQPASLRRPEPGSASGAQRMQRALIVFCKPFADAREVGIGQRARQVEPDHLGAARGVERADHQVGGGVGHPAKIAQRRRVAFSLAA